MTTHFRRLILTLAALTAVAPAAFADQKSHRKAAEELLKAMNIDKQLQTAIDQSLDVQVKANPQIAPMRDTMKTFFNKHMSWASLKDDLVTIYTEAFTESEIGEIRAFYKTPAGKKMVEKTPELMTKGMQLGVDRVQANQAELIQMLQDAAKKKAS